MDLKIKPNLINLSKSGSTATADENLKSKNLPKLDKSEILHDASNLASETNNESQSSLDVLKKQLEKLQKKLKEIDNAIKQASASQNPYAKEIVASLQTQKGSIFAQIMQINTQLLKMQGA
mgnify:CR=1 FL=1